MRKLALSVAISVCLASAAAVAADEDSATDRACTALPSHSQLKAALEGARAQSNGGFNLDMWGTVVNRDGVVCGVAFTGANRGSQWPGSRVISAQKANTANAFSLLLTGEASRLENERDRLDAGGPDADRRYILEIQIAALREEYSRISARISDVLERDLQR